MSKLKQCYFYYGAILTTFVKVNPDTNPILIIDDSGAKISRQIYKVTANKVDYQAYFKYSSLRGKKDNSNYSYWSFAFSDIEKEYLNDNSFHGNLLLFMLCMGRNLKESEIAVLTYNEYLKVQSKSVVTIGAKKNEHNFLLFADTQKREDAILIPRNRIDKPFSELFE